MKCKGCIYYKIEIVFNVKNRLNVKIFTFDFLIFICSFFYYILIVGLIVIKMFLVFF